MKPTIEQLESRDMPSTLRMVPALTNIRHFDIGRAFGWGVSGIRNLYNVPAHVRGAGQTIAIVDAFDDPHIQQALAAWDRIEHLPQCNLSVINLGATRSDPGYWNSEANLDVEWAHAIAPKAHIVLVEAATDDVNVLAAATNFARHLPHIDSVSLSFGLSEDLLMSGHNFDHAFGPEHSSVITVAASGDDGGVSITGQESATWPASNPNILAIGGTTYAPPYGITPEQGWDFSGGGPSVIFVGRKSPDVAWTGDFLTFYDPDVGGMSLAGGTSFGAPAWAGVIALIDQVRTSRHEPKLRHPEQITTLHNIAFRDITVGGSLAHQATVGYDLATGWGVPNVSVLVAMSVIS